MDIFALAVILFAAALAFYTLAGYPLALILLARIRGERSGVRNAAGSDSLPLVTIVVPAYNERTQIVDLLESLLAVEYPRDCLQLLLVSDASNDGTDELVMQYADRGIELLRSEERRGKTDLENFALPRIRGTLVVNTDASIRLHPASVRRLVDALRDPTVGVASGRDISVARHGGDANGGESGYVGYEMAVRSLETRVQGIVGASGCLYAIRAPLHKRHLPAELSRDFVSALRAREAGYRAVSVDDALCYVPRTRSVRKEYRRKVRTIARGMATLAHMRVLLNPAKHGLFAWMLWSHKICRWAMPWAFTAAALAVGVLAAQHELARVALVPGLAFVALGIAGWFWPDDGKVPRLVALPAFYLASHFAAMAAFLRFARGRRDPVWEPTRRETVGTHVA